MCAFTQAKSAAGDAKSSLGDATGGAKSAGGDVAQNAKSAVGDVKGAAQSAGRQVDQATPDLSGVFDDIAGKVLIAVIYSCRFVYKSERMCTLSASLSLQSETCSWYNCKPSQVHPICGLLDW